jgi:hypothetical protein
MKGASMRGAPFETEMHDWFGTPEFAREGTR